MRLPLSILFASSLLPLAMPAIAAAMPAVDMCAVDSSDWSEDLNDNGLVAGLPKAIADGSIVCDRQTMTRLGTFGGRSYALWQAWFNGVGDMDYKHATVAQLGEVAADGTLSIVYRISEIDQTDALAARLVETDGVLLLALKTPQEHIWVRGDSGFTPVAIAPLYDLPATTVEAALNEDDLPPAPEDGDDGTKIYRASFNLEAFAMDLPIAETPEVFPRTHVVPDYDRPLLLRFPLHFEKGELVAKGGERVTPDSDTATGIGETPASVVVPKDIAACDITAFLVDRDPTGVAVHAGPDQKAVTIATLPGAGPANPDSFGAELSIVGAKGGWFLIENATHPAELFGVSDTETTAPLGTGTAFQRTAYRGRGWVHGSRLSLTIQTGTALRAAADPASKPVFDLQLSNDGESYATVTGLKSCKGDALELDVTRSDGKTGSGWIGGGDDSRLCAAQAEECS